MASCFLFLIFLADTLGRRWSFIWTGTAMAIAMFYLGFYVRFDPPVTGAPVSAAGYVALVMVYLFAFVPFVALVAAVPLAWGWGLTWLDVGLTAGFMLSYAVAVVIQQAQVLTRLAHSHVLALELALFGPAPLA